ncbi:hypothetical protein BC826DRAFT_1047315, partial [Russula brevipes]
MGYSCASLSSVQHSRSKPISMPRFFLPAHLLFDPPFILLRSVSYLEVYYAGGAYVSLPFGNVRYWLLGPEAGESSQSPLHDLSGLCDRAQIVLIHAYSWLIHTFIDLEGRGTHSCIAWLSCTLYDLYGRGYSDAPEITY